MNLPHHTAFRYRPLLFAIVVGGTCVLIILLGEQQAPSGDVAGALGIALAGVVMAFLGMRFFVSLTIKPLVPHFPRAVRIWAYVWFYGAIPAVVLGLLMAPFELPSGTIPTAVMATAGFAAGAACVLAWTESAPSEMQRRAEREDTGG